MTGETLFQAIGLVDDDLLEECAVPMPPARRRIPIAPIALAACLCLMVGLGLFRLANWRLGSSGSSGATAPAYDSSGAADAVASSEPFDAYEGPVLPLTTLDDPAGITMARSLGLEFSPFLPVEESYEMEGETYTYTTFDARANYTDRYLLSNSTDQDITLKLYYPFVSQIGDLSWRAPSITVEGESADAALVCGSYAGGFIGMSGYEDGESWNLDQFSDWSQYAGLLSDGAYLSDALEQQPNLNQQVVVYSFTDSDATGADGEAPSLAIDFDLPENARVLSYEMNSVGWDEPDENGNCHWQFGYFVSQGRIPSEPVLIFLDEEPKRYTTNGYTNLGFETETGGVSANIVRTETTLGEVLQTLAQRCYQVQIEAQSELDVSESQLAENFDLYYRAVVDLLTTSGVLSDQPVDRYDGSRLDDILNEPYFLKRICFLECQVTIPANSSVAVTASGVQQASYNHFGGNDSNVNVYGVDWANTGTPIPITEMEVEIDTANAVEVVESDLPEDPALVPEHGGLSVTPLEKQN